MSNDKLGQIGSYDEDGAPIREDYCTHCGAGRARGDHAAECPRAYHQPITCTCKCAPEDHGPYGCKTWYGDRNTGFGCNCDWRHPPSATRLRSTHKDRLALDCGRLIIEKLLERLPAIELFDDRPTWSKEEFRQEIAQIILKYGFEKL